MRPGLFFAEIFKSLSMLPAADADLALRLRRAGERATALLRETLAANGFADLPAGGWPLLRLVASRGRLPSGEAAAALGLTAAAASQTAAAMERRGWIREEADPQDARVRLLAPGPRALERAAELRALGAVLDAVWREALGAGLPPLLAALDTFEAALAPGRGGGRPRR